MEYAGQRLFCGPGLGCRHEVACQQLARAVEGHVVSQEVFRLYLCECRSGLSRQRYVLHSIDIEAKAEVHRLALVARRKSQAHQNR